MSPQEAAELRARRQIDEQLIRAGWVVVDRKDLDIVGHQGVAVREVPLHKDAGRVDYLLYLDGRAVGVIEAKPNGFTLTGVEWQSRRYAKGLDERQKRNALLVADELPFIFEASGTETHFTNLYDPEPRARYIFNFPKPETLARIIRKSDDPLGATWRACVQSMPSLDGYDLRPASHRAVLAIEQSLKSNQHSKSLVQMATGAGKTRMAVTESYRLLKFGGFNRVLFLVDRNNLGDHVSNQCHLLKDMTFDQHHIVQFLLLNNL